MNSICSRNRGERDAFKQYTNMVRMRWRLGQRAFVAAAMCVVVSMLTVLCCESMGVNVLPPDQTVVFVMLHPNETVRDTRIDRAFKWTAEHNTTGDWLFVAGSEEYMEEARPALRPLLGYYGRHTYNDTMPLHEDLCMSALHILCENVLLLHPNVRWHVNVIASFWDAPLFEVMARSVLRNYHMPWRFNIMGVSDHGVDPDSLQSFIQMN